MNHKALRFSRFFLVLALLAAALGPAPTLAAAPGTQPAVLSAAEWAAIRSQIQPQPALAFSQTYLKAANAGAEDHFGRMVDISGDTLVVGAWGEDSRAGGGPNDNSVHEAGAAYVFIRSAGGWIQQAMLKAPYTDALDGFGGSVAIDGNTIVVSATGEDSSARGGVADNSTEDAGAAYVFVRSGSAWSLQAMLKASNAGAGDYFGDLVDIDGDTIIVGAYAEDSTVSSGGSDNALWDSGAAYVFTRSGSVWSQQALLKASNTEAKDNFGFSVAINGDTALVGAPAEDSSTTGGEADNSIEDAGAVYVFVRSAGVWSQQAMLKASNAGQCDYFSASVTIDGDTVVVGAEGEDSSVGSGGNDNAAYDSGAVYVFTRSAGVWSQQAMFKAANTETRDFISTGGQGVVLSGDALVVSAPGEDSRPIEGPYDNSLPESGASYLFFRTANGWREGTMLKADNADQPDQYTMTADRDDKFGMAVAISGNTVAVGAHNEDSSATGGPYDNSVADAGAVFVFDLKPVISVWSGGTQITKGDLTPSKADGTDFGDLLPTQAVTHTFSITNRGLGYLNLAGITISGPGARKFHLVRPPASRLSVLGSTDFQVRFNADALGIYTTTLTIPNSDPNNNPFSFVVGGDGVTQVYLSIIQKP